MVGACVEIRSVMCPSLASASNQPYGTAWSHPYNSILVLGKCGFCDSHPRFRDDGETIIGSETEFRSMKDTGS